MSLKGAENVEYVEFLRFLKRYRKCGFFGGLKRY
jgi:hypothetical protein